MEQSHLLWSTLSSHRIKELRQDMISYLRKASSEGKMSSSAWGEGKGLVFTAGNADTFSRVLTTLKLLNKHLDTKLPVEIFSFPGEIPTDEVKKELESFGAKFMVVENAVKDSTKAKSYHIKAVSEFFSSICSTLISFIFFQTAIIRSSFREVLYLDSDNLPTAGLSPVQVTNVAEKAVVVEPKWSDSAGLWESLVQFYILLVNISLTISPIFRKAYQRLGVMLWPDYWR